MQHHFNTEIAKKFGINIAVFLDHMAFWITKNIGNDKHFHDGAYWTYNSIKAFTIIFDYLSTDQIRKIIKDCEKYGLINVGNYNETKYDRTSWYSLTEYSAKLLNISILYKSQMDLAGIPNRFGENPKPIPDTKPDTKPLRERSIPRQKRVALSDFEPNEENITLSKNLSVDFCKELISFKKRHDGKGDLQYEFSRWISQAKEYKDNKNIVSIYKKEEPQRPKLRDFTQERLDREKEKRQHV